jgi:predicted ArsR family transcriptional regulator
VPADDRTRQIAAVAALADPLRRALYEYVVAQDHEVSRDEAAAAVGVERGLAAFHLDRMIREGVLEASYSRLGAKPGRGGGRPSKLYRRGPTQVSVSLPQREYELAARLMAAAIAQSATIGEPVVEVLNRVAHDYGKTIGATKRPPADAASALELAVGVLRKYGYEPRSADGAIELANCPFHTLAQGQTELACNMNHALITGVADGLAPHSPEARLCPGPDRCCVVLTRGRT